jgi:carbonic anhydrase
MHPLVQQLLDANQNYAQSFGDKAELPTPPGRKLAVLTCMDARLDPGRFLGLSEGDAHVIRNAGGRASDDAIRSLVISHKLLGTNVWLVIHHTGCGMQSFDEQTMANLLETSLKTAEHDGRSWSNPTEEGGSAVGHYIKWLTISDSQAAVVTDVRRLRQHPLVSPSIEIHGFIFDVKTGLLSPVEQATAIGRPRA